jgi:hypothetical protein
MGVVWEDLDGKKETPDNLIIRNKNDASDLYAIDGMRLISRDRSMVKRAVHDDYPSPQDRAINKEHIAKVKKKYYRKYLTPEARKAHPWGPETFRELDKTTVDTEPIFNKVR